MRYCSLACREQRNAAYWKEHASAYNRERAYGISEEQTAALLAAQGGRCAICRTDTPGGVGDWHVDHDHATGVVRGLLCNSCNIALGLFRDDEALLTAALAYLERSAAQIGGGTSR